MNFCETHGSDIIYDPDCPECQLASSRNQEDMLSERDVEIVIVHAGNSK